MIVIFNVWIVFILLEQKISLNLIKKYIILNNKEFVILDTYSFIVHVKTGGIAKQ